MNNHHSHYYSGKTSKLDEQGLCAECQFPPDDPNAHPPGEWEAPVPVYFLAVPAGQSFQFAVGKRRDDVPEHLLELAVQWLIGALEYQGAGAKTAAGYGAFQITQGPERLQPADQPAGQTAAGQIDGQKVQQDVAAAWQKAKAKKVRAEFRCTLELVTPAFLAGAKQNASDCELRPATLRGLLRWWWRTMHAGHVDARTLAQLESAVWGNTAAGGAVRISIRPVTKIALAVYDKEATKAQNALPQPQDRKTTPGLWYFSFGMDDMRREDSRRYRFQRHFVVPGARWELCLTARASRYQATDAKGKVLHEVPLNDPQMLLQQAQAALWLLCAYGGVGSKSRKGYGCFATPAELASLDRQQCSGWAAEFRRACGVKEGAPCGSPHLEDMLLEEISTPWTNYWFVLDRIGAAAQDFAKLYKHSVMKKALGLPRRIGTPMRDAFTPGPHAAKTDRHASPVMYHVVRQKDGTYTVRMTAFPSPELPLDPTRKASRSFLEKLFTHVKKLMDGWTKNAEYSKIGKKPPQVPTSSRPSTSSTAPAPVQRAAPSLRVGDIVQVVIVPDPRGKGRLFGRHEPTGLVGPIQNAERLPKRPEIGETLPVVVAYISVTGKDIQFRVPEPAKK